MIVMANRKHTTSDSVSGMGGLGCSFIYLSNLFLLTMHMKYGP